MVNVQCMYSLKRCRQVHTCECTFPRPRGTRQPDSKCDVGLAPCRGLLAAVRHERGDEVAGLGAGPARLDSTSVMPRAVQGGEVRHATRTVCAVTVTHLAQLCPRCRCPPPAAVSWPPWRRRGSARCCRHSRSGTGCRRAAASQAAVVTSHDESLVSIENFQTCSVFKIEDIKTLPLTQCLMFNVRACLW